jgi:hypothetical protein
MCVYKILKICPCYGVKAGKLPLLVCNEPEDTYDGGFNFMILWKIYQKKPKPY